MLGTDDGETDYGSEFSVNENEIGFIENAPPNGDEVQAIDELFANNALSIINEETPDEEREGLYNNSSSIIITVRPTEPTRGFIKHR